MSHWVTRDGEPSHGQRRCPKCGTDALRTIAVPWYPELEYLSCDTCHYVRTVAPLSTQMGSDVTHERPQLPLICIVDDDDGVRSALDRLLRSAGYRTVLCDSAESALATRATLQADCCIVDFHMRGEGGLHLQETLKSMHHPVPVIVVSARADEIRERTHNAGAFAIIAKPFSPIDLLEAIRAALHAVAITRAHRRSDGPTRIQRQRIRGWRLPPNTVYVGRGTKWGPRSMPGDFWWAADPAQARMEVYRDTIVRQLQRDPNFLVPLRGKNLACWCPLNQPCHADVLLDLANS